MPTKFPSDSSAFLKVIDTPANLQILFYLTFFPNLSLQQLCEKMRIYDKNTIIANLEQMKQLGLVEEYRKNNEIYYKSKDIQYHSKEYTEYANYSVEELRQYLNDEFIYSYRTMSLMKNIIGKLIHYICDFYITRMQSETLDPEILKHELKLDTSVPRLGFVTKDEYEIYRNRFIEFEKNIIEELMHRRKIQGIDIPDYEYIISSLFIPIKKVIDHK